MWLQLLCYIYTMIRVLQQQVIHLAVVLQATTSLNVKGSVPFILSPCCWCQHDQSSFVASFPAWSVWRTGEETSLVPRPLPDFISQPWSCEIKSGSGLGTTQGRNKAMLFIDCTCRTLVHHIFGMSVYHASVLQLVWPHSHWRPNACMCSYNLVSQWL